MKKSIVILKLLILIIAAVSVNASCKKKEIAGPKGESGIAGGGGNTTISNSDVFTVVSTQWKKGIDTTKWEVTIPSVLITDEVVNCGSVKVYVRYETSWWELPNARGDLFTQYSFEKGSVKLEYLDIHGSLPERPETWEYRIVTVYLSARGTYKSKLVMSSEQSAAK